MKILRTISYLGIGIRTFGHQFVPPDQVSLSVWITLLYMPIIPIRAVRCRYLGETSPSNTYEEVFASQYRDPGYDFEELERIPFTLERILYVVSKAWLTLGIVCGPFAALVYFVATLRQFPQAVFFLTFIASMTWGAVALFLCSKRLQRFLIATKNDSDPTLTFEERFENTRDRRSFAEVFREDGAMMVLAAGVIPGVVIARGLGWNGQAALSVAGGISGLFILVLFYSLKFWWSK